MYVSDDFFVQDSIYFCVSVDCLNNYNTTRASLLVYTACDAEADTTLLCCDRHVKHCRRLQAKLV